MNPRPSWICATSFVSPLQFAMLWSNCGASPFRTSIGAWYAGQVVNISHTLPVNPDADIPIYTDVTGTNCNCILV